MPNYRRPALEGRPLFVTLVTFGRAPILVERRAALREALLYVRRRHWFHLSAFVLLPDHCHFLLELPPGDEDYALRLNQLKGRFSRAVEDQGRRNPSRVRRRERAVWQRRYWEHVIRDEQDLRCHLDYLHYNPVRHGHAARCRDWPWSSFHRLVAAGWYPPDWGGDDAPLPGDVECTGEAG